jgi:hypothetical protein
MPLSRSWQAVPRKAERKQAFKNWRGKIHFKIGDAR